jgi:surface protein
MKHINTYISNKIRKTQNIVEKLKISNKETKHTLFPKTKAELEQMVKKEIRANGVNCNLNHIDTSKITDMSYLFLSSDFNGDISQWDVSNVTNMAGLFRDSRFNGDITEWDVSRVENMQTMFSHTRYFNQDISNWDVSKVDDMDNMFMHSNFNQDISNWKINNNCYTEGMFALCDIENKYKPFKDGKRIIGA